MKIVLIIIGGALGAVARYGVTVISTRIFGAVFPVGTLLVNLVGCLLIGIVFGIGEHRGISPSFRVFFITGFLGALTTFSSFSIETINNANSGSFGIALLNIAANNIGGLALAKAGLMLSKFI